MWISTTQKQKLAETIYANSFKINSLSYKHFVVSVTGDKRIVMNLVTVMYLGCYYRDHVSNKAFPILKKNNSSITFYLAELELQESIDCWGGITVISRSHKLVANFIWRLSQPRPQASLLVVLGKRDEKANKIFFSESITLRIDFISSSAFSLYSSSTSRHIVVINFFGKCLKKEQ